MEKGRQRMEHQQQNKGVRGKKDHALMHKIIVIELDRTRWRPVNENRFEVWLQPRIQRAFLFFPFFFRVEVSQSHPGEQISA